MTAADIAETGLVVVQVEDGACTCLAPIYFEFSTDPFRTSAVVIMCILISTKSTRFLCTELIRNLAAVGFCLTFYIALSTHPLSSSGAKSDYIKVRRSF